MIIIITEKEKDIILDIKFEEQQLLDMQFEAEIYLLYNRSQETKDHFNQWLLTLRRMTNFGLKKARNKGPSKINTKETSCVLIIWNPVIPSFHFMCWCCCGWCFGNTCLICWWQSPKVESWNRFIIIAFFWQP